MTGSAVVTTRLSSCAMKSATLVTTNVQMVRDLCVTTISLCSDSEWSLTTHCKKICRLAGSGLGGGRRQPGRRHACLHPLAVVAGRIHRGDHVHQHPGREEPLEPALVHTGEPSDLAP